MLRQRKVQKPHLGGSGGSDRDDSGEWLSEGCERKEEQEWLEKHTRNLLELWRFFLEVPKVVLQQQNYLDHQYVVVPWGGAGSRNEIVVGMCLMAGGGEVNDGDV